MWGINKSESIENRTTKFCRIIGTDAKQVLEIILLFQQYLLRMSSRVISKTRLEKENA